MENNYEKVDKLLDIRESSCTRLRVTDSEIERDKKVGYRKRCSEILLNFSRQDMIENGDEITNEDQDSWYLRRLDGGLFTLQTVDYILGWIIMEDDGVSFFLYPSPPIC